MLDCKSRLLCAAIDPVLQTANKAERPSSGPFCINNTLQQRFEREKNIWGTLVYKAKDSERCFPWRKLNRQSSASARLPPFSCGERWAQLSVVGCGDHPVLLQTCPLFTFSFIYFYFSKRILSFV